MTSVSVSNASSDLLPVWIEPWCDEVAIPPRSYLTYEPVPPEGMEAILPDLEIESGRLVIWAACPGTAIISINDVAQDTGSREIPLAPEMFEIPIKNFVELAFGDQPQARPGGRSAPPRPSFWRRLFNR